MKDMQNMERIFDHYLKQDAAIKKFAVKYSIQEHLSDLVIKHKLFVMACFVARGEFKPISPHNIEYVSRMHNKIIVSEVLKGQVQSITFQLEKKKCKIENQEIIKKILELIAGSPVLQLRESKRQFTKSFEYRAALKKCVISLIIQFEDVSPINVKSKNQLYTIINEFLLIGGNGFSESGASTSADLIKKLLKS